MLEALSSKYLYSYDYEYAYLMTDVRYGMLDYCVS